MLFRCRFPPYFILFLTILRLYMLYISTDFMYICLLLRLLFWLLFCLVLWHRMLDFSVISRDELVMKDPMLIRF